MNEKKICFIICGNDIQYVQESVWYIKNLEVPAGYQIDIIRGYPEEESIPDWYNKQMKQSDAKYKIYLQQGVFIIYKKMLTDLLKYFTDDSSIGMVGVMGKRCMNQDENISISWDCGCIRNRNMNEEAERILYSSKESIKVEVIDGIFFATQYDLEWKEDIEVEKRTCCIAHSCDFRRNGYKIILPYQKETWCLYDEEYDIRDKAELLEQVLHIRELDVKHGCDYFWENTEDYEQMIQVYRSYKFWLQRMEAGFEEKFYVDFLDDISNQRISQESVIYLIEHCVYDKKIVNNCIVHYLERKAKEWLLNQLELLWREKRYDEIVQILKNNELIVKKDTNLSIISYLSLVFCQERQAGSKTIFEKTDGVASTIIRYTRLKFYLRRLDFNIGENSLDEFRIFFVNNQISSQELRLLIQQSVVHKEKVLQIIKEQL